MPFVHTLDRPVVTTETCVTAAVSPEIPVSVDIGLGDDRVVRVWVTEISLEPNPVFPRLRKITLQYSRIDYSDRSDVEDLDSADLAVIVDLLATRVQWDRITNYVVVVDELPEGGSFACHPLGDSRLDYFAKQMAVALGYFTGLQVTDRA